MADAEGDRTHGDGGGGDGDQEGPPLHRRPACSQARIPFHHDHRPKGHATNYTYTLQTNGSMSSGMPRPRGAACVWVCVGVYSLLYTCPTAAFPAPPCPWRLVLQRTGTEVWRRSRWVAHATLAGDQEGEKLRPQSGRASTRRMNVEELQASTLCVCVCVCVCVCFRMTVWASEAARVCEHVWCVRVRTDASMRARQSLVHVACS